MRKLMMVIFGLLVCVCVYFGIRMIIDFATNSYIITADSFNNTSTSGNFALKITPENTELLNSYLKINNSFLTTMSKDVVLENDIKNVNKLLDKSLNFKHYYSTKLKLQKAVFEGLPFLIDNLSAIGDETFFKDNSDYLDEVFGITYIEQLNNIFTNLSDLSTKEIKFAQIAENSIIYNPYGKSIVFRIQVGFNETDYISFNVNALQEYSTKNQKAPVIIFNALGGIS